MLRRQCARAMRKKELVAADGRQEFVFPRRGVAYSRQSQLRHRQRHKLRECLGGFLLHEALNSGPVTAAQSVDVDKVRKIGGDHLGVFQGDSCDGDIKIIDQPARALEGGLDAAEMHGRLWGPVQYPDRSEKLCSPVREQGALPRSRLQPSYAVLDFRHDGRHYGNVTRAFKTPPWSALSASQQKLPLCRARPSPQGCIAIGALAPDSFVHFNSGFVQQRRSSGPASKGGTLRSGIGRPMPLHFNRLGDGELH